MKQGTELVNFETAKECIRLMVAERSRWIFKERLKPVPNGTKIARWLDEQETFENEQKTLRPTDHEAVTAVFEKYGAYLCQKAAEQRS